jgi:lipopolysaccharide transport system permease protein
MSTPASEGMSLQPATANPPASYHSNYELPDEPLVIVQASKSWSTFDFKELWTHRELLYFLTWRDVKVRYKQTVFGVAWVVLQPVVMTVIFTLFLGILVRVPTAGLPYPLLVFSGLLPWTFFSSAILAAAQSLVSNANLITKVYFPRVLVPTASIAGRLLDFAVSFIILVLMMLYYRFVLHHPINVTWNLLALPLIILLLILFTLAWGMLVSSLNVVYRDVGVVLPVLVQLWMFISPVVYSAELVPEKWRILYYLNPVAGLIQGFRASLLGTKLPVLALSISAAVTIVSLVGASVFFERSEKTFADVV